jgi:hypothetical protein
MKKIVNAAWKVLVLGGWAPLVVFAAHEFFGNIFNVYEYWPSIDVPMHFAGGFAFAYFVSQSFQQLPRGAVQRSRSVILELLLVGTITATAAVFWEFAEFTKDQLFGTNVQVSLANTMKDLAVGISGSIVFILIRARNLRAGITEIRELTSDWVRGLAA